MDLLTALNDLGVDDLGNHLKRVNQYLQNCIQTAGVLNSPLKRLLMVSGKRLRPALTIAVCKLAGGKITDRVIRLAAATELVHLATLIHDDIIDDGRTRWQIPTINSLEGPDQALLAGDYLLSAAGLTALEFSPTAATLIGRSIQQLCDGEARELVDQYNLRRSESSYFRTVAAKTGALFAVSARLGGLAAGLQTSQLNDLEKFGHHFGICYQLLDDLVDFLGDPKITGKPTGVDINSGNYTLAVIRGLKMPIKSRLAQLLDQSPRDLNALTDLLTAGGCLAEVRAAASRHAGAAQHSLNGIKNLSGSPLSRLGFDYQNWVYAKLLTH